MELIGLGGLLGSVIFVIGLLVFIFLLKKIEIKKSKLIMYCILQLSISITLSIIIWYLWIFQIDIMFEGIFLPGLFAEMITIASLYFLAKKINRLE